MDKSKRGEHRTDTFAQNCELSTPARAKVLVGGTLRGEKLKRKVLLNATKSQISSQERNMVGAKNKGKKKKWIFVPVALIMQMD